MSESYTYFSLAQRLQSFGLLDYLDEISSNIVQFRHSCGIEHLNVAEVAQWITQLSFLTPYTNFVAQVLSDELIDGFAYHRLSEDHWTRALHLNARHFFLLNFIKDGWAGAWGTTSYDL